MSSRYGFVALLSLLIACGSPPPSTTQRPGSAAVEPPSPRAAGADADTPMPPELRLPRSLMPMSNRVRIALDPSQETFSGRIEIEANVIEPIQVFWLNAQDITIGNATIASGAESWPLAVLPQNKNFVGFRAPVVIPEGTVTIGIDYRGAIDSSNTRGIFRQKERDAWYAFTQLEAIDARRVFPCFDEPDSKVPWQLTLEVPAGLAAFSNTPVASTESGRDGSQIVSFEQTPPLPSYLVAFAVGPFDAVDAGTTRSGAPIRVIVARGRGGDTGYVAQTTPAILALLEDYFGIPYPYSKLDLVGIPLTVGFGAMENPGLITFRQDMVVARPRDLTIEHQRRWVGVAAHELAHQWFGDLVTMTWWNDLWLNEAFATWMGQKVTDQYKPEWGGDVGMVRRRASAIAGDSLASTRKIRQPIESENDIDNAFDGITYGKGASVIEMFERWVGEKTFQAGVRAYLTRHSWSNATAGDFLDAISEAAELDVKTPFSTFLDQVGAPLIRFDLECEAGRSARVAMTQKRYLPQGSQASSDQMWQVPVCVAYPGRTAVERDCTLLADETGTLELTKTKGCPAWLLPNDGMLGYYRSSVSNDLLRKLVDQAGKKLSLPQRVGVIGDIKALVDAGTVDSGVVLGLVAKLARDDSLHVARAAAEIAESVQDLVSDQARPRYARFISKTFGARARKLGWKPRRRDSEDTRLLRNTLLSLVTDEGADAKLAAPARALALAWLANRNAVDKQMVDLVLTTAALHGDAALWQRFHDHARTVEDRRDRQRLLGALASFRDPALVERGLGVVIAGEFDIREASRLLYGGLDVPRTRRLVYDFVKDNYDRLLALFPEDSGTSLVQAGSAQCDATLQKEITAFFEPRMNALSGGPRAFAQAMERMDLCIKRRDAQRASVDKFLARW